MDAENKTSKIHPLMAAAALALILACLTGMAAMMGLLPNFSKSTPAATIAAPTAASEPAVPVPAPTAPVVAAAPPVPAPVSVPAPAPAPKVVHKKPVKKPVKKAEPAAPVYQEQYSQAPPYCPNCGVVESVRAIQQEAPSSGIGAGVGAVLGGLLGNQIGGGTGQTVATIAGAVGGGYAGNVIEKRRSATTAFEVIVRMDEGGRQRFIMQEPRWRSGDAVRVGDGNLYAR